MFLTPENKLNWSKIGIATIVVAVLVFAGIFWFDIPVFNFLRQYNCGVWDTVGKIFNNTTWLAVSGIIVVVFYLRKMFYAKSKFSLTDIYAKVKTSYAFWVFCSVFLAASVGWVLKSLIGRARPIFYEALNMTGFFPIADDWAFYSMPSGHTLVSFAGLVMIGLIAPRIKWFTWTLATVIGISRVCVGAHWPSDVIFGAFIGMLAADVVISFMTRRGK